MHFAFLPFCHVVKMAQFLRFALIPSNTRAFAAQYLAASTLLNTHLGGGL
jgi:hypothetical protein